MTSITHSVFALSPYTRSRKQQASPQPNVSSELRKKQRMEAEEQMQEDGDTASPSPMNIATPNNMGGSAMPAGPRILHDTDPIQVNLDIALDTAPEELREGLAQIVRSHNVPYFHRPECGSDVPFVWQVGFERSADLPSGSYEARTVAGGGSQPRVLIRYYRAVDAFRALGQVLTAARTAELAADSSSDRALRAPDFVISEKAQFETLALMIDCSRNGVLSVQSVYAMLRNMALMGFNMLQLYTEDTYKVAGEPFFGYLRGGYTQDELRAIDDYAFSVGIEVVPCIQTLGHLGQILQWPRFAGLRDTNEVILSRLPETYELLEKLIATVSAPLRSKRIHIGMDEAYGVGEGRFRSMFGAQEGTAIFVEHLARVHAICAKSGLRAMIWSDMLFCLAAKNNALYAYYDQSNNPADALSKVEGIPPDVDLVFWDYYHTLPEIYARKIQQHRDLGCASPWMAGGAWTWSRLWCYLPFSFESNRASLTAAKSPQGRVASFMLTIWGDEGNECDFFSALPVMLYAGNHAYTDRTEIDPAFMENTFSAICGGSLGDWMHASRIDDIPQDAAHMDARSQLPSNMSKWLLWEDPMLSFMSPQYAALDLETHYTQIADRLLDCALSSTNSGRSAVPGRPNSVRYPLNRLLRMPGLLARVLSLKCHLRDKLIAPYRAGDRAALLQVVETRLRPLIEAQRELWLYHRSRWHRIYKPFGWETLELRYGGLTARLQTMYDRLVAYSLQQPGSTLRRSRAIGVAAGISRHPALLPQRSRNPSKSGDIGQGLLGVSASEVPDLLLGESSLPAGGVPPGPSMSTDEGSGLSVGAVPAWLPVTMPDADLAVMGNAGSPPGELPVATVSLGWPVTAVATTAATTAAMVTVTDTSAIPAFGSAVMTAAAGNQAEPMMTSFPQHNFHHQPSSVSSNSHVTTINALGVRELGGEGDFWLQPAPLLPPELDPLAGAPSGVIGCLGEETDDIIDSIPELEEDLHCIYENSHTSLLLDYGRVTAPSRLG
ncbi:hypothetical protein GGI06_000164 [Coemansia sp. S85]|nr:hypothetical protein GGI06_000164 [Coemansia sp. S85]